LKLPKVLGDGFLKALPEPERRKLGRAGITSEEAIVRYSTKKEKDLQGLIWNELHRRGVYVESDRMDKRTSGKKGRADFRCCVKDARGDGRWLSLECKVGAGTLTSEQGAEAARLRASGGKFVVVRSLEEAIEAVTALQAL
jgi:hypothetical protein